MIDPKIITYAIDAHQNTNHLYDDNPYTYHLGMVVNYAFKYLHIIPEYQQDNIIAACWLHDTIEDTRKTYNDIMSVSNSTVADIVYALTNEKGKNRKERANDKYYEGIRNTPFAVFVKLCDRLANVKYSIETKSRMKDVYEKENNDFIESLFDGDVLSGYDCMVDELNNLFLK